MSITKIRGIIIRENKSGEADKFITIYAKNIGKITIFAKGACNIKSKFLAGTSIFTYGDFVIRTATKTPTLNSVDIIESFYSITSDLDKYYCGTYLLEFILKAASDVADDNRYLILLLKALMALKNNSTNKILVVRVFELKMLKYLGYNPFNDNCVVCGSSHPHNLTTNGLVCDNCKNKSVLMQLSDSALYTLKFISDSNINELFKFSVNNEIYNELAFTAEKCISYNLDVNFKSYDYVKNLYFDTIND